jgi:transposase
MRDRELYAQILGVRSPWSVHDVRLDVKKETVEVLVEIERGVELACPQCGRDASRYDARRRSWRHLDTCQFHTVVTAEVPRVSCSEHGVLQVKVPWAEEGSSFTALMERLVIDWLKEASTAAVSRRIDLSWDEVDGIMGRAVARGLARRKRSAPARIGVDETSFQRRHEYVTVVSDLEDSAVLYVANDRKTTSLDGFYETLTPRQRERLEAVAMDMWAPYIQSTTRWVPDAESKITFDKFHVAKHLGDAVDQVRRIENRELLAEGDRTLVGSKYHWLANPLGMKDSLWFGSFRALRESTLRSARAWAIKEAAMTLWGYVTRGWAARAWRSWIAWALRSRLEPVRRVARMVRENLGGILNAIALKATNAVSESMNAKIQKLKAMACGFRNRERFRNAIYFHLGGLDLYPTLHGATHTTS